MHKARQIKKRRKVRQHLAKAGEAGKHLPTPLLPFSLHRLPMQGDIQPLDLGLLAGPQAHDGLDHVKDDHGGNRRINDRDGGAEELLADGCPFAGRIDRSIGKKPVSTAPTKPPTPWTPNASSESS